MIEHIPGSTELERYPGVAQQQIQLAAHLALSLAVDATSVRYTRLRTLQLSSGEITTMPDALDNPNNPPDTSFEIHETDAVYRFSGGPNITIKHRLLFAHVLEAPDAEADITTLRARTAIQTVTLPGHPHSPAVRQLAYTSFIRGYDTFGNEQGDNAALVRTPWLLDLLLPPTYNHKVAFTTDGRLVSPQSPELPKGLRALCAAIQHHIPS